MTKRFKRLKVVKVTFKDILGWSAETNERGTGFNIFNNKGEEVAHYILQSKSLWLHPSGDIVEYIECKNLPQAVRYACLKTLPEIQSPTK